MSPTPCPSPQGGGETTRPTSRRAAGFLVCVLALSAVATASIEAAATAPADCAKETTPIDYARKADLPAGVVDALGFPMAEAGEPFQATDVIREPHLPFERFVSARRTGCQIELLYERGGIALRHEGVTLDSVDGKWTVRKPPAKP